MSLLRGSVFPSLRGNCRTIVRTQSQEFVLFHEIATQPTAACNDVSTQK
ncbi:hypothetical protein RAMDARK_0585 [Rickettsia amblyommatis str. Darkwater]|nr:hypothetical protein RAMDARK_0585 [Rickettsia amblyommatis str. Darkwater]